MSGSASAWSGVQPGWLIVRRRDLGESFWHIGRAMNLDKRTVSRSVRGGCFQERAPRSGTSLVDAHREHVVKRLAEGCTNPAYLWNELRSHGFAGSLSMVRSAMSRLHAASSTPCIRDHSPKVTCPSTHRACAWLVGWSGRHATERRTKAQQRFVAKLCELEPAIAVAGRLARHFLGLIHRRDVAGFDRWLDRARSCPVPELRRFAVNLGADLAAVRAAFSSPWSSGQVEGQVNRLKFLKRQMYGRANLDLLRLRVLHPN